MRTVLRRLNCSVSPSSPTSRKPTAIVIVNVRSPQIRTQRLLTSSTTIVPSFPVRPATSDGGPWPGEAFRQPVERIYPIAGAWGLLSRGMPSPRTGDPGEPGLPFPSTASRAPTDRWVGWGGRPMRVPTRRRAVAGEAVRRRRRSGPSGTIGVAVVRRTRSAGSRRRRRPHRSWAAAVAASAGVPVLPRTHREPVPARWAGAFDGAVRKLRELERRTALPARAGVRPVPPGVVAGTRAPVVAVRLPTERGALAFLACGLGGRGNAQAGDRLAVLADRFDDPVRTDGEREGAPAIPARSGRGSARGRRPVRLGRDRRGGHENDRVAAARAAAFQQLHGPGGVGDIGAAVGT